MENLPACGCRFHRNLYCEHLGRNISRAHISIEADTNTEEGSKQPEVVHGILKFRQNKTAECIDPPKPPIVRSILKTLSSWPPHTIDMGDFRKNFIDMKGKRDTSRSPRPFDRNHNAHHSYRLSQDNGASSPPAPRVPSSSDITSHRPTTAAAPSSKRRLPPTPPPKSPIPPPKSHIPPPKSSSSPGSPSPVLPRRRVVIKAPVSPPSSPSPPPSPPPSPSPPDSPAPAPPPGLSSTLASLSVYGDRHRTHSMSSSMTSVVTPTSLLDLDEVIRRHAWKVLNRKLNFLQRIFIEEANYICQVDWSALSIEHKLVKFAPKQEDNTEIETKWGTFVTGSRWQSLWSCEFDNKADSKQAHTFRGSRDTVTWVDIDLDQCYTINKQVCVEVNIPQNLRKFSAGRTNSFSLNRMKGQVFKEVLTWEVNSQVEVLPGWKAQAQLMAREECNAMEFEIRTTLCNPKGVLPVVFIKRADKDKRPVHFVEIEDFREIFKLEIEGGVLTPEEKMCMEVLIQKDVTIQGEETTSFYPQIVTKGSCVSMSWSDQKVDIKTSRLCGDEATSDGDPSISGSKKNISEKTITVKAY